MSAIERMIIGFHQDEEGHWVADLECGHTQHVRHDPAEGRFAILGKCLVCRKCASA